VSFRNPRVRKSQSNRIEDRCSMIVLEISRDRPRIQQFDAFDERMMDESRLEIDLFHQRIDPAVSFLFTRDERVLSSVRCKDEHGEPCESTSSAFDYFISR